MGKRTAEKTDKPQEKVKRKYQQRTVKPESLEVNEVVEGRLLDIQDGTMSDVLCIAVQGQGIKRLWQTTVLSNSISRLDIGKYIKIKYKGEETSKAGRDVKIYDVWVEDLDE